MRVPTHYTTWWIGISAESCVGIRITIRFESVHTNPVLGLQKAIIERRVRDCSGSTVAGAVSYACCSCHYSSYCDWQRCRRWFGFGSLVVGQHNR